MAFFKTSWDSPVLVLPQCTFKEWPVFDFVDHGRATFFLGFARLKNI